MYAVRWGLCFSALGQVNSNSEKRMRKFSLTLLASTLMTISLGHAVAQSTTYSGKAIQESGKASGHVAASAGLGLVASGQVTSAVVAVPLSVGGAVLGSAGGVSAASGQTLMQAATAPIGTPLAVSDEVITVMPPNQALKPAGAAANP
jgi:hypothetical protein